MVEKLYTFFGYSIKRWDMLSSFFPTSENNYKINLKRLCPTRWSSRYESLYALRYRYLDIMKCLTKLVLLSKNSEERIEASGLKKYLEKFDFIFLVVLQTKILEKVNAISKLLQSKDIDLAKAASLLSNAIEDLTIFRNEFDLAKIATIRISEKWGGQIEFKEGRRRKVKCHFDELCEDRRLANAETFFRVNVFERCLNIIISQLDNRFQSMKSIVNKFSVIQPTILKSISDDDLYEKAQVLVENFKKDISPSFPEQLLQFRSCLKSEISKQLTIRDLATLLIIENNALSSSFPEVCTALILFLSIPVTVASAERSFSKLKLIKNYLRSTIGQERLCALAILSIENDKARK